MSVNTRQHYRRSKMEYLARKQATQMLALREPNEVAVTRIMRLISVRCKLKECLPSDLHKTRGTRERRKIFARIVATVEMVFSRHSSEEDRLTTAEMGKDRPSRKSTKLQSFLLHPRGPPRIVVLVGPRSARGLIKDAKALTL